MRTAGRVQGIGFAAPVQRLATVAFALAFLACGAAMASDIERQVPAIRDAAGSDVTIEISREGTRRTATPVLTLNYPTVQQIEGRIAKKTAGLAAKGILPEATAEGPNCRTGLTGTPREDSGRPKTSLSSPPPVEEITVRSVKGFLKELRASRKEKPAPAAVVAAPELRLGRADTSPREAN